MRLIGTIQDDRLAHNFSDFLKRKKIDTMVEITKNTNWAENAYGTVECRIWVYDEDQFEEATKWLQEFREDPTQPKFQKTEQKQLAAYPKSPKQSPPQIIAKKSPITLWLIGICTLIFFSSTLLAPHITKLPKNIPQIALLHNPISAHLWFDYPTSWEIVDKLESAYGIEALTHPEKLPPEAKVLIQQANNAPVFGGFYDLIVRYFKQGTSIFDFDAPLFEKIRQGQLWRLFTPAILHMNLIHLFFNMIWLYILGAQMEERIGKIKLLLFILLTGIFSNTAQYLMSGPNFLGFSGVVCAMVAYIWTRQLKAPWEGYRLESGTMIFISLFVLILLSIQILSFILEIFDVHFLNIPIANTAHIMGALAGFIIGRFNLFAWKRIT